MALDAKVLNFKPSDEWMKEFSEDKWRSFVPKFAERNGQKYMKAAGRKTIYRFVKLDTSMGAEYVCTNCNSDILSVIVSHLSKKESDDRRESETVPYCPRCEPGPESPLMDLD